MGTSGGNFLKPPRECVQFSMKLSTQGFREIGENSKVFLKNSKNNT
jgi:hypothetical protein